MHDTARSVAPPAARPRPPATAADGAAPRALLWLWNRTLNSVWFGIGTMAALAAYIAVGSGLASVREFFELNEAGFFNAWPMWLLAVLLCSNILVVTFERIPFTPPRYGVWTIHVGIVVLVFGMVYYFKNKTEGLTLVNVGQKVDWYYDAFERALYVKVGRRKAEPIPLPDLPRFAAYAPQHGNAGRLDRDGLRGIAPTVLDYDPDRRAGAQKPLHQVMDLPGAAPVTIDVLAYYPYAVVGRTYEPAPGGTAEGRTGIRLTLRDAATGASQAQWIIAGEPGQEEQQVGSLALRHLHRDDELTGEQLLLAAQAAHSLRWQVRGDRGELTIEPGQRKPLGATGYEVEAVEFLPGFPMFGSGQPVDTLELLVHPPADSPHGKTFRRYVLDGLPTQTDFVLGVEGAGPKGQRQTAPVDPELVLRYDVNDALHLLPHAGATEHHIFLTRSQTPGLWQLLTSNTKPAQLAHRPDGKLPIRIDGLRPDPHTGQPAPMSVELDVERFDHVARQEWVREVPPEQRDRRAGESGMMQVLTVRVARGDWEQIVNVPFAQWPDLQGWTLGEVRIPGSPAPVQLQLGNMRKPIPATVKLERFELVPYAGDFTPESAMRDFKSHLTLTDRTSGAVREATAHLNSPVYFDHQMFTGLLGRIWPDESWLLYQSQWDPEGQRFTVLGVGNRPGVMTMTVGCTMVVTGLLWAFYVKPILIRRMKEKALAAHAAKAA